MNHLFPGWPGHAFSGRQHQVAPVAPPIHPHMARNPGAPQWAGPSAPPGLTGYPGPAPAQTPLPQSPAQQEAADQALPGGSPAGGPPPHLAGMAAYGVPLRQTPAGHSALIGGGMQAGLPPGPPNIPGMPQMPSPQSWFPESSGLFQTVAPVAPFDHTSQIRRQS